MSLFHPTYFPSILQYAKMLQEDVIEFEIFDNYQKQTYRNRCYIYGANGKHLLNIPIQKVSGKQLTKDIKIDYSSNWQSEHLKSLISAYRSSPFFEFYIDDLLSVFKKEETFLVDINIKTFLKINKALEINKKTILTTNYQDKVQKDFRYLVNAKSKTQIEFNKYTQVFDSKHGFLSNLSMLDLLFNEGPSTEIYLNKIGSIY